MAAITSRLEDMLLARSLNVTDLTCRCWTRVSRNDSFPICLRFAQLPPPPARLLGTGLTGPGFAYWPKNGLPNGHQALSFFFLSFNKLPPHIAKHALERVGYTNPPPPQRVEVHLQTALYRSTCWGVGWEGARVSEVNKLHFTFANPAGVAVCSGGGSHTTIDSFFEVQLYAPLLPESPFPGCIRWLRYIHVSIFFFCNN